MPSSEGSQAMPRRWRRGILLLSGLPDVEIRFWCCLLLWQSQDSSEEWVLWKSRLLKMEYRCFPLRILEQRCEWTIPFFQKWGYYLTLHSLKIGQFLFPRIGRMKPNCPWWGPGKVTLQKRMWDGTYWLPWRSLENIIGHRIYPQKLNLWVTGYAHL